MAGQKNEFNAWFLLAVPIIIFFALHQIIPAIDNHLLTNAISIGIYYCVGIGLGLFLFQRARVVRDHEWHRRKHIKKLQRDYAAEDRGVWSKADLAMSELEADAAGVEEGNLTRHALQKLEGNIGGLTADKQTSEIENSEESLDDFTLLSESEHVRRSTARVTGKSGPVESVQGVTHARDEPERGLIGGVLDKLKEIDSVIRTTPSEIPSPEPTKPAPAPPESNDWYAQEIGSGGGFESISPTSIPDVSGNRCPVCDHYNSAEESYCENCGDRL